MLQILRSTPSSVLIGALSGADTNVTLAQVAARGSSVGIAKSVPGCRFGWVPLSARQKRRAREPKRAPRLFRTDSSYVVVD